MAVGAAGLCHAHGGGKRSRNYESSAATLATTLTQVAAGGPQANAFAAALASHNERSGEMQQLRLRIEQGAEQGADTV